MGIQCPRIIGVTDTKKNLAHVNVSPSLVSGRLFEVFLPKRCDPVIVSITISKRIGVAAPFDIIHPHPADKFLQRRKLAWCLLTNTRQRHN